MFQHECRVRHHERQHGVPIGRDIGVSLEVEESLRIIEKHDSIGSLIEKSCTIDLSPGDFIYAISNLLIIDIARVDGEPVDHGAGIHLNKKTGEPVEKGDVLFTIYADKEWKLSEAIKVAEAARFSIASDKCGPML